MTSPLSGPILIVEDDADIREALQGFLELKGYEVSMASDGREALERLEHPPRPALILLDMAMPVMGGHRVLAARSRTAALQQVPVVIISAGMGAMSARDRALYAANYDVAAFLEKPADPQQVLNTIELHALRPPGHSAGAPA
ncbi:MAG: response regulator [Myxococcaceae bacterium]|nr:response regulator [Myxococcaceae bacterium]